MTTYFVPVQKAAIRHQVACPAATLAAPRQFVRKRLIPAAGTGFVTVLSSATGTGRISAGKAVLPRGGGTGSWRVLAPASLTEVYASGSFARMGEDPGTQLANVVNFSCQAVPRRGINIKTGQGQLPDIALTQRPLRNASILASYGVRGGLALPSLAPTPVLREGMRFPITGPLRHARYGRETIGMILVITSAIHGAPTMIMYTAPVPRQGAG